jgi:hypothetical protein
MAEPAAPAVAEIVFAAGLFDLEAIKNAAYRLSGKLSIEIEPTESGVLCRLRPIAIRNRAEPLSSLEAAFSRLLKNPIAALGRS